PVTVKDLPEAIVTMLPAPRDNVPPLIKILPLAFSIPVFARKPIFKLPRGQIVNCFGLVVNVAPEAVVPMLTTATPMPSPTDITSSENIPACENDEPLPCTLSVADELLSLKPENILREFTVTCAPERTLTTAVP